MLAKEKKLIEDILGDEVIGIRQHYLNLAMPDTWRIQENIGLNYDSSFGSSNEIGFKENKYLPLRPFNNSFLVIPLTIMDTALFQKNESVEDVWVKCSELINQAKKHGALLTVLWHQRVFNEKEFSNRSLIYEELIKLCKQNDAWITTAREIERWWNNKW